MRSLRVRLLIGTALGMTAVLLVTGAVLYALISRTLRAEFDTALAGKARSLAALVEQEGAGLEFDLTEVSLPEFEPSAHAEYYQVWLPDGAVFARSPSLRGGELGPTAGPFDVPVFETVRLPDGRPGRVVSMTFVPRREVKDTHANRPLTVTLMLGRDTVRLRGTLARVRGVLFGVGLAAVILSAGVLAGVVGRSLRPVNRLSRQIASVGEEDLSVRIDAAGIPDELGPVVDRLNDLLARLEAAFQRERRFTGDVAHELRTPLAGLRAKLETALSRDRASEAYREALGDCLEINLHLQRMVENLLHLARADAGQLEIRREPVDLSDVIKECWKSLEAGADARGLTVDWRLQAPDPVRTDRDKLRLVVQNLLDNAVTYANDEGQLSVETRAENGAWVLIVRNTGHRLRGEEVHRVFDRFWRADPSCRDADDRHCGLGLPLCEAVMKRLGGTIEATTGDGMFTITIRLPGE